MSTKKNSIDMLHGPLPGKIILFAIPLALSSILQQLFNSANAIVAGRLIGSTALAAIGGVSPGHHAADRPVVGLSIGANVAIAIHIGHKELDRVHGAVQTTAIVTLVSSVALTAVGVFATEPILDATNIPADARVEATGYLQAYFAGIVFFLVYNFGSAVLRAKGDTRRPLYALAVAVALNIVLNVVAVTVFDGGVVGIAVATDVSNAAAAGIIVWMLLHEEEAFRLDVQHLFVDADTLRTILYIGVPSGLQSVVFSLSNVAIQAAINGIRARPLRAGSAAAMNYEYYTYFFVSAFSQGRGDVYRAELRRRQAEALRHGVPLLHGRGRGVRRGAERAFRCRR